ncbi:MAG: hypothetical protein JRI50_10735 [Deltaproteobacteria bacterium]|nr:hypothetical protein [Deltaproteobacteria bacterium]MBW1987676.1 hypothetical protein [Deltaproteobacteria bacterium]
MSSPRKYTEALIRAVFCVNGTAVRQILAQGADSNARDKHGVIALDYAIRSGHLEIADILRQAGDNPFVEGGISWY